MPHPANDAPILLIDGECVLCNRVSQFVMHRDPDRRFRFAALQSETAKALCKERGLPPPPAGTFVLLNGPEAFYRSEAALRTLGMMPAPWKLAGILLWIPRPVRDMGYDLVARTRLRLFGSTSLCGLLSPAERARFLLDEEIRS